MRLFMLSALLLAVFQTGVWAATNSTETPPLCGIECIEQEVLKSTCDPTNATCICTNVELTETISLCVTANCTVREALLVQSYSKHSCGAPSRDRSTMVWVIGVVFLVLGVLSFGLRVMARIFLGTHTWGPDDWVMLLAVAMMVPLNSISFPISRMLGKDIWNVHPDDITDFLYLFFWDELLYLGALPVTKISILLFYLKIFPAKSTRIACWVFIGLNIGYFIAFELVSIFQCSPIEGAWRAWDKEFPAKCNNINMQGWMAAVFNIVLDLGTLIIPLPALWALSLSLRKKVQIMLMFSVGFFIVRLQSLASYATTHNVTQDYVEVGYWSTIEVPVGIICACMPSIRSLFSQIFPKVFGSTQRSTPPYTNLSGQSKPISNPSRGSKMPAQQSIRVDTDFSVRSKHRDDSSTVELTTLAESHEDRRPESETKRPMTPSESV
ncbi:hypothetical protein EDB81DRAFT_730175 [Dactylonectria macrodidyma]|uniref:CFEM domain-containing protein n=1 Tax=Dactylonectria macrodidyma TaxID=307937 RepID=A0A9P9DVQ9_9HYPO|nr:hypothetical protein EDB81DRAFT_730175 [Dactylonectria macrodidyma]